MSLTAAEETFVKNSKKKADLEADIKALNEAATITMGEKRDEVGALQIKLSADVKAKQDQIDAL